MTDKTAAKRQKEYIERQRKRGVDRLRAWVEPDVKARLVALAKETGSYNAAFEKLLACHEERAA